MNDHPRQVDRPQRQALFNQGGSGSHVCVGIEQQDAATQLEVARLGGPVEEFADGIQPSQRVIEQLLLTPMAEDKSAVSQPCRLGCREVRALVASQRK